MSNISLVTGGAGFIGSHLVDALVANGQKVRVLDDFSTGLRSNLDAAAARIEIVEGSITDPQTVARAVRGVNVVYHLGALASVARSVENPPVSHAACATGTLLVLDESRKAGVKRVVFAASLPAAYGGRSNPTGQVEDQPLCTLSPYAAAKLAGEFYMQAFAASLGIETVRLRFFNIFGPRQRADSPYSGVIALFTALMTQGKRLRCTATGCNRAISPMWPTRSRRCARPPKRREFRGESTTSARDETSRSSTWWLP